MPILTTGPTYSRDGENVVKRWKLTALNITVAPITVTFRVFELTPQKALVEVPDSPKCLNLASLTFDTVSINTGSKSYTSVQIEHPLGLTDVQVNLYGLDAEGHVLTPLTYQQKDLLVIDHFYPSPPVCAIT